MDSDRMADSKTRYRWEVFSRSMAGIVGGYGLTQLLSISIGMMMYQADTGEAQSLASIVSLPVFIGAVIWVFSCSTATRAWVGIGIPLLIVAGITGLLAYG